MEADRKALAERLDIYATMIVAAEELERFDPHSEPAKDLRAAASTLREEGEPKKREVPAQLEVLHDLDLAHAKLTQVRNWIRAHTEEPESDE